MTNSLAWILIALSATTQSATAATAITGTGNGLTGSYYPTMDFTGTPTTRVDPTIDFNWPSGPGLPGFPTIYYSVVWTGQIQAQYSETYALTTMSDDGILVWIDGRLAISNWSDHGPTTNAASLSLTAGRKYDITIRYYNHKSSGTAILSWSSQSTPKEVIPRSQLYSLTARSQLAVTSPVSSRTSPAWIEGTADEGSTAISASGNGSAVGLVREGRGRWYLNGAGSGKPPGLVLADDAPVDLALTATIPGTSNQTARASASWTLTDLANLPYGMDSITIRPGDSLLLGATGGGTVVAIDADYSGSAFTATYSGTPASRFAAPFATAGIHDVRARRDGVEVGRLTVLVASATASGPIADEVNFTRSASISIAPAAAISKVVSAADDPSIFLVGPGTATATGLTTTLLPLIAGTRQLQARIGGAAGPVIASFPVDAFALTSNATEDIGVVKVYPDGSQLGKGTLTMTPLVHDLSLTMRTIVSGVTFQDSTTTMTFSSNSFTAITGAGTYAFYLLRGPTAYANMCHTYWVVQGGQTISYAH